MTWHNKPGRLSAESRARIARATGDRTRGKPQSPEHRARIGAAQLGRTPTFATRLKISTLNGGSLPPDYEAVLLYARSEDRKRLAYARRIWKKYRLTTEDEARIYARQSGRCLCGRPFNTWWRIDHDHATNRVRGLLHHHCNYIILPWIERAGVDNIARYLASA